MAGLKEIQDRIHSVQDTRKITGAMYMISSTKMKKARHDLEKTEPYFYMLQATVERIMRHIPQMQNRYFEDMEKKRTRIALLVITGDRGLAGAYNHNVLKLAQEFLDRTENEISLYVVGELGRQYFARQGIPLAENFKYTAQNPTFDRARWITEMLRTRYLADEIDEIQVIYTRMENSMYTKTEVKQLLPIQRPKLPKHPADVYHEEFMLLPSPEVAVDTIVPNYLTGFVYGALIEAFCSEQNDRMLSMEAANGNADALLHDLGILYNRARQAAITQEITEVSSGARAQRRKRLAAGQKKKRR